MNKTVEAEYIAEGNVLKLVEPLAGVRDHERVLVTIDERTVVQEADWPSLSDEGGRELAGAVREAFGRENIAV